MFTYILSQFRARFVRTLSVIIGIAIGTGLFMTLWALGNGYREAASLPLEGIASDIIVTKSEEAIEGNNQMQNVRGIQMPFGLSLISLAELQEIQKIHEVEEITAVLMLWDFAPKSFQTVVGVSADQANVGPAHSIRNGLTEGRAFEPGEREVAVVDRHYALFFDLKPGSEVLIGDNAFEVVGIIDQADINQTSAANLYIPLEDAQQLADVDGQSVNQVYVSVTDTSQIETVVSEMEQIMGTIQVISEDSLVQVMGGIGKISVGFAKIAAVIGLIGGLLLAWFALTGMINERQKDIAIMKAVGWGKHNIRYALICETILLSLFGGFLGILIGLIGVEMLQKISLPDLNVSAQSSMPHLHSMITDNEPVYLPVKLDSYSLMIILLAVLVSSLGATWTGIRKVLQLKPAPLLKQK